LYSNYFLGYLVHHFCVVVLSWFDLAAGSQAPDSLSPATRTTQFTRSSPPVGWGGKWEKVKLVGWGKDSLIRQQRKE